MTIPYLFLTSLLLIFSPTTNPVVVDVTGNTQYSVVENYPANNRNILDSYTVKIDSQVDTDYELDYTIKLLVNPNNDNQYYGDVWVHTQQDGANYFATSVVLTIKSLYSGYLNTIGGYSVNDYYSFANIYVQVQFTNVFGCTCTGYANFNSNQQITLHSLNDAYWVDATLIDDIYNEYTDVVTITFFITNGAYDTFYTDGYQHGLNEQSGWTLSNYLYSIVDLPVLYLKSLFGFDLFGGISLFAVITSLITISIVLFVIRKFIG